MKHSYKQKRTFKIVFQTKNKVWIYKNSRLRNFYNIRSKIIVKPGKVGRRYLVFKNMKWTVTRRKMVPYFRKVRKYSCHFKKMFFTKQQLKNFYGGLKEYEIRNFFKKTWNKEQLYKTNIFIGSLEQRLGVILYRMRLLPTIFACNQLIQHHGIYVNNNTITFLNYRVKLGDIVSVSEKFWLIFYSYLFKRLEIRNLGEIHGTFRKEMLIKKFSRYLIRNKAFFYSNFGLIQTYKIYVNYVKNFRFLIKKFYIFFKKNFLIKNNIKFNKKQLIWIKIFYWILQKKIILKLSKLKKSFRYLYKWNKRKIYFKKIKFLWFRLKAIFFKVQKLSILFEQFLVEFLELNSLKKNNNKLQTLLLEDLKDFESDFLTLNILEGNALRYSQKYVRKFRQQTSLTLKNGFLRWHLRKLKYKQMRKNFFKHYCLTTHWYVPKYLEIDYTTLCAAFVYYPTTKEVYFPFQNSFKRLVSFYKERAL